ncbi:MAG: hypothetical protein IJR16_02280 [Spirochaetales bacterium]|nr:hypothetical protein [Spirochaetales bacterium]
MEYLTNLLLLFFIYSFAGWCIEVTLKFRQYHRFINRGFLTGPCLPIYGSGCALITAATDALAMISKYESSYGSVFAVAFVLCGTLEYMVSFFLEKRFHARWWDYSQKPMNLQGRIWIGNLLLFGLGGVLVVKITNPVILRFFAGISLKARYITAIALSVVFITDYLISHFVLKLVKDSVEKSEADNTEAIGKEVRKMLSDKSLFAKRFADAYPEVIYRTEKVKARMEAIKAETERLRQQAVERLAEAKQQISEKLEPTSQIKNRIIENQDRLISSIYEESTAGQSEKQLKSAIDKDLERLKSRRMI